MSEERNVSNPWEGGTCRVAMWCAGSPAGLCGAEAFGPQLPEWVLYEKRNWRDSPFCSGPCCPSHGGPAKGEPIIFHDGWSKEGRPIWCAVLPGFVNLQESHAEFSEHPLIALAAIEKHAACLPEKTP